MEQHCSLFDVLIWKMQEQTYFNCYVTFFSGAPAARINLFLTTENYNIFTVELLSVI